MRLALGVLAHLHQLEHFGHTGFDFRLGELVLLEAEGDVVGHGHVREQRIGLKHHVDRTFVRRHVGDVDAVEVDTPLGRALETGQHAQQRGLAGARAAKQSEDFALVDLQGHIVHRNRLVELLGDPIDPDQHLFGLLTAFEGFLVGAGGNCHG
ncbi:hypothetical protein ALP29_201819 [Pseudomonas syringae pv. avii]|uniref:Uncharacterized protein n=1 Tax=Pseudomonas syringae pv. avii TaxID=663959 RepID=A0A3M5UFF4_PSESX|nr:hypothetical protein ALP29_201819 [Pseudomonas syringae pv. avii]